MINSIFFVTLVFFYSQWRKTALLGQDDLCPKCVLFPLLTVKGAQAKQLRCASQRLGEENAPARV